MAENRKGSLSGVRILLVDDHAIFRQGVRRLLLDEGDDFLIDEAGSGGEALERIRQTAYQVVFLDINLPGRSGLDWIKSLLAERPALRVVVLSMYHAEQYAVTAFRAGARGYVSKDMGCDELLDAVRTVIGGGAYIPPEMASQVVVAMGDKTTQPPHFALSPRELQILMGIVNGRSLTMIGQDLLLSVKTVSTYRGRILAKLELTSNAELVSYAIRQGLIA